MSLALLALLLSTTSHAAADASVYQIEVVDYDDVDRIPTATEGMQPTGEVQFLGNMDGVLAFWQRTSLEGDPHLASSYATWLNKARSALAMDFSNATGERPTRPLIDAPSTVVVIVGQEMPPAFAAEFGELRNATFGSQRVQVARSGGSSVLVLCPGACTNATAIGDVVRPAQVAQAFHEASLVDGVRDLESGLATASRRVSNHTSEDRPLLRLLVANLTQQVEDLFRLASRDPLAGYANIEFPQPLAQFYHDRQNQLRAEHQTLRTAYRSQLSTLGGLLDSAAQDEQFQVQKEFQQEQLEQGRKGLFLEWQVLIWMALGSSATLLGTFLTLFLRNRRGPGPREPGS